MGLQLISESYLDVMARKAVEAGLAFEPKMIDGKHYKVLVEDCLAADYDLVVMGALGMGAVKDSQLGSVTDRFVRRVSRDTLIVRNIDALKEDRKSTRLNSSHDQISYAVFCLKKKKTYIFRHLSGLI